MIGNKTMKPLIFAAFIVTSIAAPLAAQEADSMPASATDWGGFYLGGGFMALDGDLTYAGNTPPEYGLAGKTTAAYAGFNLQNGQLVYGAEAAYALGGAARDGDTNFQFNDVFDVKARLGVGLGDALIYGVAGWSSATWDENGVGQTANGLNLGLGVDYQVSEGFFVGVEYIFRDLEEGLNADFLAPLRSIQLRAGLNF